MSNSSDAFRKVGIVASVLLLLMLYTAQPCSAGFFDVLKNVANVVAAPVVGLVVDGGKTMAGAAKDVATESVKIANSTTYMGGIGSLTAIAAITNWVASQPLAVVGVVEKPSLRVDLDRGMLVSQGGIAGTLVNHMIHPEIVTGADI